MVRYLSESDVRAVFGNPAPFILADGHVSPRWEEQILAGFKLSRPLPLAWDRTRTVSRIRCHRLILPFMRRAFTELCADPELWSAVHDYSGCYNWRAQRRAASLSRHSWGIAIDLNADENPLGATPRMDPGVVEVFERNGFYWGGRFKSRKDGMHFEWGDLDRLVANANPR